MEITHRIRRWHEIRIGRIGFNWKFGRFRLGWRRSPTVMLSLPFMMMYWLRYDPQRRP